MDVVLTRRTLGEQERAYICTDEFREDDIMARLGLDLGTEAQNGGSSHNQVLNIPPQLSEPSTSDPPFPPSDAAAQTSTEFDAMTYMAALDAPLPTSTGWDQDPQLSLHVHSVFDTNFIVPTTTPWSSWPDASANKGLNGQESVTTGLNPLSPEILVPSLSQQLLLVPQGHTIDPSLTSLHPPQFGRPRANTAPTVLRDVTLNTLPSYPQGSPISVPPSTPRDFFGSEGGSSASSSPFSQTRELPSYGNHPGSNSNPRLRSASVSTGSRGRPLTRPRRMVERVLDPARLRPHLPVHTDIPQGPIYSGSSSTPQHLDVPLIDWFCGGSDGSDYNPDSPSTPPNLSRASSTSSVHRRPRSRSRSGTPYSKPSGIAAGDGITGNIGPGFNSTEYSKPYKNRKRNGRDGFPGQRLHFDEKFMETVLGDEPPLRKLLDNVLGSLWRKDHTMEPNYGAKNDDVSQGLDLPIEWGSSVLLAFIRKDGDEHVCILCKGAVSARVPRQLGHVRGHIDLRPFACKGCDSCDPKYVVDSPSFYNQCPYVSIATLDGSFLRIFFKTTADRQNRAGVLTGALLLQIVICPVSEFVLSPSGEKMRQHNLKRHVQTKHPHLNSEGVPYVKDFTSHWETTPFLPPPAFEPLGISGNRTKTPSSSRGHSRVSSTS